MSMIRFVPVGELTDPMTITVGISGASGTGKTYTALMLARGIAEGKTGKKGAPIGIVDTENRRALHYRADFPEMVHYDMRAVSDDGEMLGFGPERWIEVIDAAEAAKLPVLVIDSFSHEWEGVGGVLDLKEIALDRLAGGDDSKKDSRSQLAWAEVKPRHRRLIDRIVRAKCDIIICTRAKPVMQDFKTKLNARPTKTRRKDVPWDVASDGDLMFEMTAMVMLDPKAPGRPTYLIKCADGFKATFDQNAQMGVHTGLELAKWSLSQGDGRAQKAVMDAARAVAGRGTKAFTEWWNSDDGKAARGTVRPIIDELKDLASEADKQAADSASDDPFGTAANDGPTPEQMAAAESAAREAAAAAAREAGV